MFAYFYFAFSFYLLSHYVKKKNIIISFVNEMFCIFLDHLNKYGTIKLCELLKMSCRLLSDGC